jgi:hypothetical protein
LKCNKHAAEPVLETILFPAPSRFQRRHAVKFKPEPKESAQIADFGPDAPKLEDKPCERRAPDQPTWRPGLRLRLTHLLMVPIEDYREKRGGQNIEDNDIDVRMSFDQSEH